MASPSGLVDEDLRALKDQLGAPLRYGSGGYSYSGPFDLPLIGYTVGPFEIMAPAKRFGTMHGWRVKSELSDEPMTLIAGHHPEHFEAVSRTLLRTGLPQFLRVLARGTVTRHEARGGGRKLSPEMGWFVVDGEPEL